MQRSLPLRISGLVAGAVMATAASQAAMAEEWKFAIEEIEGSVQDAYAHVFALLEGAVLGPRPARRPDLTHQPGLLAANGQAKDGPPDLGVVVRDVRIAGIGDGERALRVVGVSPR